MPDAFNFLLPPGVSIEWLEGYRTEICRQERERIIDLLTSEHFPFALCLPTSEDGDWEPVMEPEIRAALDPNLESVTLTVE